MTEIPEPTYIFRMVHIQNLDWILQHGLQPQSGNLDPNFVAIGHPAVIDRRKQIQVSVAPFGTLSDYVPFYFCARNVMHYNLITGHNCQKQVQDDLIYLVSSTQRLLEHASDFVVFDRNATLTTAQCYSKNQPWAHALDWEAIKSKNFQHDPVRPDRKNKQQAECLIYGSAAINSLHGVVAMNEKVNKELKSKIARAGVKLSAGVWRDCYFL